MVTNDDVKYVAKLARLRIDDAELERYSTQLSSIINHIDKLSELDLSDVEPTSHVIRLENVFRDDVKRPSVTREKALENGPEIEGDAFRVPPILEG